MSFDVNPYEPPATPTVLAEAAGGGLWRQGNLLVIDKNAPLPYICIKSNEPADGWLQRKLNWHHPVIVLSLLASPLIYIILAAVLNKRATIRIGLSERWFAKRRMRIAISWILVLGGIGMFVGGIAIADQFGDIAALPILGGVVVFVVGLIFGIVAARLVTPNKITDEHVWLKGVHPDFLAKLPDWPYY